MVDEAAVEDGAEEIMMEVEEVVAEVEAAVEVDEGVVGVDEAIMKDEVEEVEIAEEDNHLLNKLVYVWHIGKDCTGAGS